VRPELKKNREIRGAETQEKEGRRLKKKKGKISAIIFSQT